jgi:hypothetical protein
MSLGKSIAEMEGKFAVIPRVEPSPVVLIAPEE